MTINLFDCDAYAPSVFEDGYDGGLLVGDMPYVLHVEVTKVNRLVRELRLTLSSAFCSAALVRCTVFEQRLS